MPTVTDRMRTALQERLKQAARRLLTDPAAATESDSKDSA